MLRKAFSLVLGTDMKIGIEIAQIAQMACMWEACAPKPGNVNRSHDFPDASLEDFLLSAVAIGPAFENAARLGVGETIWAAAARTRRCSRSNTNLGVILLFVPLIKACLRIAESSGTQALKGADSASLRKSLSVVLGALTVEDARHAYSAIRLAQPGGLGRVSQADVAEEPSITLLQAMNLAKKRDSIAREYATNYGITFEIGLPALSEAVSRADGFSRAIVQAFLEIMSRVPDTLIIRKRGIEPARRVSRMAKDVLKHGGVFTPQGRAELKRMDRELRDKTHTMNPGATADLTAAAIFVYMLQNLKSGALSVLRN
jgi:triphosphoribosyl-dephospho-CoA synthase